MYKLLDGFYVQYAVWSPTRVAHGKLFTVLSYQKTWREKKRERVNRKSLRPCVFWHFCISVRSAHSVLRRQRNNSANSRWRCFPTSETATPTWWSITNYYNKTFKSRLVHSYTERIANIQQHNNIWTTLFQWEYYHHCRELRDSHCI